MRRVLGVGALLLSHLACDSGAVFRVELPGPGPTTIVTVGEARGAVVDRGQPIAELAAITEADLEAGEVWAIDYADSAARLGLRVGPFASSPGGLALPTPARGVAHRLVGPLDGDAPPRWEAAPLPAALGALRFDFGSGRRPTAGCHTVRSQLVSLREVPDAPHSNAVFMAPLHGRMWVAVERSIGERPQPLGPVEANLLIIDGAGAVARAQDARGGPVVLDAGWADPEGLLWRIDGSTLTAHRVQAAPPFVIEDAQATVSLGDGHEFRWLVGRRDGAAVELHALAFDGAWLRVRATVEGGVVRGAAGERIEGCPLGSDSGSGGLAMSAAGDVVAALSAQSYVCFLAAGADRAARTDVGTQAATVGAGYHPGLGLLVADDDGVVYAHTASPGGAGAWRQLTDRATAITQAGHALTPLGDGLLAGGTIGTIAEWRPDVGWCPQLPGVATQSVRLIVFLDADTFFTSGTIPDSMLSAPLPIALHRLVR